MATDKKVTRVGGSSSPERQTKTFVPTPENKAKAGKLRWYAVLFWVLAIVAQVVGILILLKNPTPLTTGLRIWLIVALVFDLIFLIIGSAYWKKANRLDPASEKNALKFLIQSQAGVGVAIVAFLPVVILAFIKKEYIVGAIAALFMVGGGAASADYSPPSVEKYTEQADKVKELMGKDHVYWTKHGTKYHLYDDCQHLKGDRTDEIFEGGTVADAYANNSKIKPNDESLCKTCENRAIKEKNQGIAPVVSDDKTPEPETSGE
jgi:hypothetical protein